MWRRRLSLLTVCALAAAPSAVAAGEPDVAALQAGLRSQSLYAGDVDGVAGPQTTGAVLALQRRAGLTPTGIADASLRRALGSYGRQRLASRPLGVGDYGWEVTAMQFRLAWRGFPSGPIDGHYTERTARAVRLFQGWARLTVDGAAGPKTLARLRAPAPRVSLTLSVPVAAPISGSFGVRGNRFHSGIDFAAATGAPVGAAGKGKVTYAGWQPGGWGYLVTVAHGKGLRTMYAHLSRIDVRLGQTVRRSQVIGAVGATGRSSGPHLHFEARLRGAAVDPRPLLGTLSD